MTGIHRHEVRFSAAEKYPTGVSWLHEPAPAVDKAICIGNAASNFCRGSFAIRFDDRFGDPNRHFLSVVVLGGCPMGPHKGRCGMRMGGADEHLVGLEGNLFGDDRFGLFDNPTGHAQAIDDTDSNRLGVGPREFLFDDQRSSEQRVDDALGLACDNSAAYPDRKRFRIDIFCVSSSQNAISLWSIGRLRIVQFLIDLGPSKARSARKHSERQSRADGV